MLSRQFGGSPATESRDYTIRAEQGMKRTTTHRHCAMRRCRTRAGYGAVPPQALSCGEGVEITKLFGHWHPDLCDALHDLDQAKDEAREEGFPPPSDKALGNAWRLLHAMYRVSPRRFEVYPTPDGEIAIDAPGGSDVRSCSCAIRTAARCVWSTWTALAAGRAIPIRAVCRTDSCAKPSPNLNSGTPGRRDGLQSHRRAGKPRPGRVFEQESRPRPTRKSSA